MPYRISRQAYAETYGPTTGDRVRLAGTDLRIEVQELDGPESVAIRIPTKNSIHHPCQSTPSLWFEHFVAIEHSGRLPLKCNTRE